MERLDNAPFDDEPLTDEDVRAIEAGRRDYREGDRPIRTRLIAQLDALAAGDERADTKKLRAMKRPSRAY